MSGVGYQMGVLFGVCAVDTAAGLSFALWVRGVYTLPKAAGAVAFGAALYWDNVAHDLTTTVGSNQKVGVCTKPALAGDAIVEIRLTPG